MAAARRVQISAFDPAPENALTLEEFDLPPLQHGQVRLRMAFAPVNPADLNVCQGTYGKLPDLPATPGIEGFGHVESTAGDVTGWPVGTPAIPLHSPGTWATHIDLPAADLIRLPDGLSAQQAAMLRINPATAWRLLHTLGPPEPGSWVVQNAANSGVGTAVSQLAGHLGLHCLDISRNPPTDTPHALADDPSIAELAPALLDGRPVPLALNAVGGDSALRLMNLLSPGGTHVTYGAMARRPLKVPNSLLIFKNITLRGFWLTPWIEAAPRAEVDQVYATLAPLVADGTLHTPVDSVYPVSSVHDAVAHAGRPSRSGKILLDLS